MRSLTHRTDRKIIKLIAAPAAVLMLQLPTDPAQARRVWPVVGGAGDASVTVQCPAGEQVVGLSGRIGLWIDQIQLLCAMERPGGIMGAPHAASDFLGGSGGAPRTATCNRGSRLSAVGMTYTANRRQVAAVYMECTSIVGATITRAYFQGGYGGSRSDANACAANATCSVNTADVRQFCPQERFVGFTVRVGRDVNAVGFICDHAAP